MLHERYRRKLSTTVVILLETENSQLNRTKPFIISKSDKKTTKLPSILLYLPISRFHVILLTPTTSSSRSLFHASKLYDTQQHHQHLHQNKPPFSNGRMTSTTELDNLIETSLSLISRLNRFGTSSLASREVRQELADLIQAKLREMDTEFARVKSHGGRDIQSQAAIESYSEQVQDIRILFRKAQVASKKNVEKSLLKERQLLFEGRKETKEKASEKTVLKKSSDITSGLKRVHAMAQGNVLRGEMHLESLEQSSQDMQQLQQKYTSFDVLLAGSKKLVQHLEQADRQDRIFMMLSLGFLGLVVSWILYRRVLKLPLMIITWPLLKVFGLVKGKPDVKQMGPKRGVVETVVQTVVETVAESLATSSVVEAIIEASLASTVLDSVLTDLADSTAIPDSADVIVEVDESLPDSAVPKEETQDALRDEL